MSGYPTRFSSGYGLAELPWFECEGGRLVLRDRSVGPVVDMHTHVALSYVAPPRVDLMRRWPRTDHYLPLEGALDLQVYVNRNFSTQDLARMRRDLVLRSVTAGGMRRTHTLANLAEEMHELGIVQSCLLPIDLPLLSDNAGRWLTATAGRSGFVCFGSVHPYAPRLEHQLRRQLALGARGIKLHPAVQLVPPSDRRAMRLYRLCGEHGLPVLFHCGPVGIEPWLGRQFSQVRHYARAIEGNPETTFILGHSGALQMEQALDLALAHDNVYLELSSQSLDNVRRILDSAPADRILFGSDWPFYHQAIALAKVLIATGSDPGLRASVLYDNAARLLGLERPGARPAA